MVNEQHKKTTIMIFLFTIFVLLMVLTGGWIYKVYNDQKEFTNTRTLATVECGKYYFSIDKSTVVFNEEGLYFEIENTMGSKIENIVVESAGQQAEVNIQLSQGAVYPVSVKVPPSTSIMVYPEGCRDVNYKNISFEPNI